MALDTLERVQEGVAAKMRSDSFYDDVAIYSVRNMTVEKQIADALTGTVKRNNKAGLAIQVLMPIIRVAGPALSGGAAVIAITVRIQEIPTINYGSYGTQITSELAAMHTLQLFQAWNLDGGVDIFTADSKAPITPSLEYSPRITYDVRLLRPIQLTALSRVAVPQFSVGATVAITSATASASIYYTTDIDVFPSSASGATLYTAAFATPASGTTIYAAAYKTGMSGSNVAKTTIA